MIVWMGVIICVEKHLKEPRNEAHAMSKPKWALARKMNGKPAPLSFVGFPYHEYKVIDKEHRARESHEANTL